MAAAWERAAGRRQQLEAVVSGLAVWWLLAAEAMGGAGEPQGWVFGQIAPAGTAV